MKTAAIAVSALALVANASPITSRATCAPKSNSATVDLIGEFEGFSADICERSFKNGES